MSQPCCPEHWLLIWSFWYLPLSLAPSGVCGHLYSMCEEGMTPRPTTEPCWALAGWWPDPSVLGPQAGGEGRGVECGGIQNRGPCAHHLLSIYQHLASSTDTHWGPRPEGLQSWLSLDWLTCHLWGKGPPGAHPISSAPGPAQIYMVEGRVLGIEPDSGG